MCVIPITFRTSPLHLPLRAAVAARFHLALITSGTGRGPHGGDHKIASSWVLSGTGLLREAFFINCHSRFTMDFKKTIFEACAAVPSMGSAIAAAYDCIFEANVGTAQASST